MALRLLFPSRDFVKSLVHLVRGKERAILEPYLLRAQRMALLRRVHFHEFFPKQDPSLEQKFPCSKRLVFCTATVTLSFEMILSSCIT